MTSSEQDIFYQKLGDCIRKARLNANLKQEVFAKALGLSRASIVNIEKGRQHPPLHLLWVISKILSIDVVELLPEFIASDTTPIGWGKIITNKIEGDQNKQKIFGFLEEISNNT